MYVCVFCLNTLGVGWCSLAVATLARSCKLTCWQCIEFRVSKSLFRCPPSVQESQRRGRCSRRIGSMHSLKGWVVSIVFVDFNAFTCYSWLLSTTIRCHMHWRTAIFCPGKSSTMASEDGIYEGPTRHRIYLHHPPSTALMIWVAERVSFQNPQAMVGWIQFSTQKWFDWVILLSLLFAWLPGYLTLSRHMESWCSLKGKTNLIWKR